MAATQVTVSAERFGEVQERSCRKRMGNWGFILKLRGILGRNCPYGNYEYPGDGL